MSEKKDYYNALPTGYQLEQYQIIEVLGAGGFGIAYLANDTRLDTLVVIKEYLPNDLSVREQSTSRILPKDSSSHQDYESGLKAYIEEARTIAKFDHPNIVQVKNYIEANNTAYIVMNYVNGSNLAELAKGETATEEEIRRILFPLLDGLRAVHQQGYLHRDIKPANIFIQHETRNPVLIDFGAARFHLGVRSKSMTSVVSAGFSPYEQYHTGGKQGAWTDIYAMGGVLYRLVSGKNPPEAPERITATMDGEPDPLRLAVEVGKNKYSVALLRTIDYALALKPSDRPQTVDKWLEELNNQSDKPKQKMLNQSVKKHLAAKQQPSNKGQIDDSGEGVKPKSKILAIAAVLLIGFGIWFVSQQRAPVIEQDVSENTVVEKIAVNPVSAEVDKNPVIPQMQTISGGSFQMGCVSGKDCEDNEKPVHKVTIKTFDLGVTEVTFEQWQACVDGGGCQSNTKPDDEGWGRGKRPVINVSWNDVQEYMTWLKQETGDVYRLPTEAEWEYAARAGSETKYHFGNSETDLCDYANHADKSTDYDWCNKICSDEVGKQTAQVASYKVNPWGLYDMHGNVWEWTCSVYEAKYKGSESVCANEQAVGFRVLRGGSWNFLPNSLRSATRLNSDARERRPLRWFSRRQDSLTFVLYFFPFAKCGV